MRDGGRLRLLWRWLLVGTALDWLLVLTLFATIHLGEDGAGMDVILLPFVMLVPAWIVHVVALPHLFEGEDGALSPTILPYKGVRFWIAAVLISTAAGFGSVFAGINIITWVIPVRTSLDLVPTRLGLPLAAGASGSKLVRAGIRYIHSSEMLPGLLFLMFSLSLVATPGLVAGLRLTK